jgi:DNA-binding FrmR family transcriptional regulator
LNRSLQGIVCILYTPTGYAATAEGVLAQANRTLLSRLARIEGQVRGVARMIEEDRYCIDILNQIQAVKSALRRVEENVLKNHAAHCVAHAIESGNAGDQTQKFSELVELFGRYGK